MRALGIILAGGNNNKMRELSNKRAVAAMPVAGSFRSIDFALSSMANSHIQKVAVLTQYNARSLNEHLSSSKWWDFGRKHGGLFVFSPTVTSDNSWWYRGTADAISQNLSWLKNSHEPYVVIASGDGVYKLDFNKVLEYHIAKRADVTVVCTDSKEADTSRFGVLKMNEDCRIEEFEEKPMVSSSNVISTGIYVIRRRQLIEMIERSAQEDRYDFVKDILIRYKNLKRIYGYKRIFHCTARIVFCRRKIVDLGVDARILAEEVISYLRFQEIHVGSVIGIYGSNVAPVGIDLVSVNPFQVFVTD